MTDTRPVRDQAEALLVGWFHGTDAAPYTMHGHAEDRSNCAHCAEAADTVAPVIAAALAERDALRATVNAALAVPKGPLDQPTGSEHYRYGYLNGYEDAVTTLRRTLLSRRALDGATQAAPRPSCEKCGEPVLHSSQHLKGGTRPGWDCVPGDRHPAAQGVPVQERLDAAVAALPPPVPLAPPQPWEVAQGVPLTEDPR